MNEDNTSISKLVDQFVNSFRKDLVEMGVSINTGDTSAIQSALSRVKNNGVAKHIANLVASCAAKRDELALMVSQFGVAGEVMLGLVAVGAGFALRGGAAGIATMIGAAAGTAVASVMVVVGIALMVIGGLIVANQLQAFLSQKFDAFLGSTSGL